MAFLSGFKTDRLVAEIIGADDTDSPAARKAAEKLKKIGPAAVPRVIDALANSTKQQTVVLVEVLAALAAPKSLKHFVEGLSDGNQRIVAGTAWALSSSRNLNPNELIGLLDDDDVSRPAVIEILKAHRRKLNLRELLTKSYDLEHGEKAAIFGLVEEVVEEDMIPELIARLEGKDPIVRVHLIRILGKFNRPEVIAALEAQLRSNNKLIRQAALAALGRMHGAKNVELVAKLLLDGDLDVQSKAVDLLVRMNDPQTVRFLIPALKDESEYPRRAAVEVLNEIGTTDSVKDLLQALQDDDWWVRARATDALAKIGGPKVMNAALALIRDEDQEIRRAAIEILNATKDDSAVKQLIEATADSDWWVRERAVDALAGIGSARALPALTKMLGRNPESDASVVRALAKIGDATVIDKLLPMLNREDREIRVETIKAIAHLADEAKAEPIRNYLEKMKKLEDSLIVDAADNAIKDLNARFSYEVREQNAKAEKLAAEPARTLLIENADIEEIIGEVGDKKTLDISTLQPGDVIDDRYVYVKRIGKGAFGTVLLMQDKVVDERLILKFLNPNVSSDEEMMKRFVHELRFSRRITHPNVIRIYDFLSVQGLYAISMEYFPSHTLGAEIAAKKPMDFAKALQFAKDIATGMSVAHEAGVIHRDLKPANILINKEGLLKIVDFGVAAAATAGDTQLTKTGYVIGSPKYMAPEQILGKRVDEKADIYSLGVIVYEMLTGTPPYTRGDHMSVMYQHVQGKARKCQDLNPDIPDDLATVVTRTMALDKNQRYASMAELREELERVSL
ncbi:MAG: HEAT repeat domain-containing protein [Gammaproteobacteria bacterium]|jgi:HEAT repeat protein/tRNA A-37 threonylcarbamoyl transferase component Bud32